MNNNELNLNSKAEETLMNLFSKSQLEVKKLSEITDHYNSISKLIGLKAVKKFRDKATAVNRTLEVQETYSEDLAEQKAKTVKLTKPSPSKKVKTSSFHLIIPKFEETPKQNTIEHTIYEALVSGPTSIDKLVDYIVDRHERPRSGQKVDEAYALHNIKWFAKKGSIEIK